MARSAGRAARARAPARAAPPPFRGGSRRRRPAQAPAAPRRGPGSRRGSGSPPLRSAARGRARGRARGLRRRRAPRARRDARSGSGVCGGPHLQGSRYLPATEETYAATAWISAGLSWALNDGIAPLPVVTRSTTSAFGGFFWSRFGPTVPVAPASLSVWQLVQPAFWKTALPCATRSPPPPPVVVVAAVEVGGGPAVVVVAPAAAETPATDATYAATSSASEPVTSLRGIPGAGWLLPRGPGAKPEGFSIA